MRKLIPFLFLVACEFAPEESLVDSQGLPVESYPPPSTPQISYGEVGRVINLPCGHKLVDFEYARYVGLMYSTRPMREDEEPVTTSIWGSNVNHTIVECR